MDNKVLDMELTREVALLCLQTCLQNLYDIWIKRMGKQGAEFRSQTGQPVCRKVDLITLESIINNKLSMTFDTRSEKEKAIRDKFCTVSCSILQKNSLEDLMASLDRLYGLHPEVLNHWGVEVNDPTVGTFPSTDGSKPPLIEVDMVQNRLKIAKQLGTTDEDILTRVELMLGRIRQEKRQPRTDEFFMSHFASILIQNGGWTRKHCHPLGTPGFHPHTQTYMSLTDPGFGHVRGTTRCPDWLKGVLVHVEYIERPNQHPPVDIESYRIPSPRDMALVRLHVGLVTPTTCYIGRVYTSSENFDKDFVKVVHMTASAASFAFSQGAAECKISMLMLSTHQATRYMRALKAQVTLSKNQILSAAWNITHSLRDDLQSDGTRNDQSVVMLKDAMEVAMRTIEITSLGGFHKVTWDGAGDSYPSKCVIELLTEEEALTVVHEAHLRGLLTYFSAGFTVQEIPKAVFSGVDGVGIGSILHFVDRQTGMHGPYKEEEIPQILRERDDAAGRVRGRGASLLARLDSMYFEGSISQVENELRLQLFDALKKKNDSKIECLEMRLRRISALHSDKSKPFLHRAKRLLDAQDPLMKMRCDIELWKNLLRLLKPLSDKEDETRIMEEYDRNPWRSLRDAWQQQEKNVQGKPVYNSFL